MKVLTPEEVEILENLEIMQLKFKELPPPFMADKYREMEEVKKSIDHLKHIVSIRAMLRDGDGQGLPSMNELPTKQKQIG
jgi:hypothetical protein